MGGFNRDLGNWFEQNADQVRRDLNRYFGAKPKDLFTGRWFDQFAVIGDPNRFEASDLIAVGALKVKVPPEAAATLLLADSERFNSLLRGVRREQDLWDVPRLDVNVGSNADDLHAALKSIPDIGWVTAGKLLAAKRPRLIPILDERVEGFLNPREGFFWLSMYDELSDPARRTVIEEVCRPQVPPYVSLLRRIDVAIWMAAERETEA